MGGGGVEDLELIGQVSLEAELRLITFHHVASPQCLSSVRRPLFIGMRYEETELCP